jgi:hypothetical protein
VMDVFCFVITVNKYLHFSTLPRKLRERHYDFHVAHLLCYLKLKDKFAAAELS